MSWGYEAKLEDHYRALERAQDRFMREDAREKKNLQNLAKNMPPKMQRDCIIRKEVELNEGA